MATEISVIQRDDTFLLFFNGARMARDLSPSRDEPSTFRFGTRSEGVSRRGRGGRVCRSMRRRDSIISAAPVKTRPNAKRARSSHPFPSVSELAFSTIETFHRTIPPTGERKHHRASETITRRQSAFPLSHIRWKRNFPRSWNLARRDPISGAP